MYQFSLDYRFSTTPSLQKLCSLKLSYHESVHDWWKVNELLIADFHLTQYSTLLQDSWLDGVHRINVSFCLWSVSKLIPELPIPRGGTATPLQHPLLFPAWCTMVGQGMLDWTNDRPGSCSSRTHRPATFGGLAHFERHSTQWAWQGSDAQQPLEIELRPTIACDPNQVGGRNKKWISQIL
jgi:hypothetical protein